uniref:Cytochrome b-c1 complex subunit 8 n=1 Tax=Simulium vittatum TaxID=7192 RepID=B5M0W3_SIMVI|nr:ubiquinol cytochrome c reductase subunit QCR8 [Simulium vittatum]
MVKTSLALSSQHFGELAKVRGIVVHKLSPFEQRAFAHAVSHGIPNIFRRIRSNIFRVAPPLIIGYLIYDQVERTHTAYGRKNPAEFANDE